MIDLIIEFRNRCTIFKTIGKAYHLTEKEVSCVTLVSKETQLTSKSLSASMHLSPSRGSRIINKLIVKEFLQNEVDATDRRSVLISLTQKGEDCMASIEKEKMRCERELLAHLNSDEVAKVEAGFNILLKAMGD